MRKLPVPNRFPLVSTVILFCQLLLTVNLSYAQSKPPVVQWMFASPTSLQSNANQSADWIYSITQSPDGNYIAVGYTQVLPANGGGSIPVAMELDQYGNIVWEKIFYPTIFNPGYGYFSGTQPQPSNCTYLLSLFVDVHEAYYDNSKGEYVYIASGEYADGNSAGFVNYSGGSCGANNYFYATAFYEDGTQVLDPSNACFGTDIPSADRVKEFWAYSLTGPSLTYPDSWSNGYNGSPGNVIGQAIDPIVSSGGYNSIKPIYNASADITGFIAATTAVLTTSSPSGEGMLIKLDSHLNIDNSFGETSGSSKTGYEIYNYNSSDNSGFQGVSVINNYSTSPSFVASGYDNVSAYSNTPCAYIICRDKSGNKTTLPYWDDLFSTFCIPGSGITYISNDPSNCPTGGFLTLPAFTTNVDPVTGSCGCTIAANNHTTAPEVEHTHIGTTAEILANVWCNWQQPFNVQNYYPLIGSADPALTFQNVVLKIDSSNGALDLPTTTGAPHGAAFIKQFEGIDFFSRIVPIANGGYAFAGDLSFTTPQIPDNELASHSHEHLITTNDIVQFDNTDTKQWDQLYYNNYEPSTNSYAGQNCMFGFAATSDGGYIIGGNNELYGDDYYATKLQPPPCSGTTSVSTLNSPGSVTVLPYGAIIGSPLYVPTSSIGPLISTNTLTVWSTDHYIQGFVDIQPGYTLKIDAGVNIQFASKTETGIDSKIVVEPGAELDVYGTLTGMNSCIDEMWDGIELRGQTGLSPANSSQAQNPTNMGKVIMENGSTLSNADLGIFTMKINVDQSWDFNHTGGIITGISGANFTNNIESVDMQVYNYINPISHQPANTNLSNFTGCNFTTDNFSSQPVGFDPGGVVHVCLNRVYGVDIYGNTFRCYESYPASFVSQVSRGIGINSYDATYKVSEECNPLFNPCSGPPNTFEDLQYGILATSDVNGTAINVNNNAFINNVYDILLEGAGASVISQNSFTKSNYGNEYVFGSLYNIYVQGVSVGNDQYTISGNTFSSTTGGIYNTPVVWSTVVNKTDQSASSVDNNTYQGQAVNKGIIVGIQPQETNDDLSMLCNTFTSTISTADIDIPLNATIALSQGTARNPAGNEFSQTCGTAYDINTSYAFDYYWQSSSTLQVPLCTSGPVTGHAIPNSPQCPLTPPNWTISALASLETHNKHVADSVTHILAAGNASHLYTCISAGYTPARLQDSMLNAGPYLSDGVLNDLIALDLPFDTLRNILVPNAPVDNSVQTTLNSNSFYTPAQHMRIDTITGISARTKLEDDSIFSLNEAFIYQGDIIMYYLNDTIASNIDSAINALYGMGGSLNHGQLAQLAALQYENNDSTSAFSTISSLSGMGDAEYTNYCTLLPLIIHLQNEPSSVYALKKLPSDSSIIAGIAMDSTEPGYAQARSLLEEVYKIRFADPIIIDTGGLGHHPEMRNNGKDSIANISQLYVLNNFKLYPNPANSSLTIAYSLNSTAQEVNLVMYDILGNKVASWVLSPKIGNTIINENISSLAPGMYFYTIFEDNKVVQRNKLVIER